MEWRNLSKLIKWNQTCYQFSESGIFTVSSLSIAVLLTNLAILVVAGNLLVLLAFVVDRRLRTPTHYFIGSLAAADLALGILVLPFAVMLEITGGWTFGVPLCQIWLAVDVWLCTASIYGLIMVGVDRYIAVTRPLVYRSFMTHTRACFMIAMAWTISLIICLPTFVVSSYRASKTVQSTCQCTQMIHGPIYIIYSSVGSFYLPMAIIGYVYARIYLTVRRIKLDGMNGVVNIDLVCDENMEDPRVPKRDGPVTVLKNSRRRKAATVTMNMKRNTSTRMTMRVHKGGYHPEDQSTPLLNRKQSERFLTPGYTSNNSNRRSISATAYLGPGPSPSTNQRRQAFDNSTMYSPNSSISSGSFTRRNSNSTSFMGFLAVPVTTHLTSMWYQRMNNFHKYHQKLTSELSALRTVGIVTGCFVVCWIGFCIVYTIHALPQCKYSDDPGGSPCVPDWVINMMVWFGYANSAINPLIYTANGQFRRAFRILLRRGTMGRTRSISLSRFGD